jgi:hypothetical protein
LIDEVFDYKKKLLTKRYQVNKGWQKENANHPEKVKRLQREQTVFKLNPILSLRQSNSQRSA